MKRLKSLVSAFWKTILPTQMSVEDIAYKAIILDRENKEPSVAKPKTKINLAVFGSKKGASVRASDMVDWDLKSPIVTHIMGDDAELTPYGVGLTGYSFTVAQIAYLLGVNAWELFLERSGGFRLNTGMFPFLKELKPGEPGGPSFLGRKDDISWRKLGIQAHPSLPSAVKEWAWNTIAKLYGLNRRDLVPGHSGWLIDSTNNRINFIIRKSGKLFPNLGRKVLYRIGKDMHSKYKGEVATGLKGYLYPAPVAPNHIVAACATPGHSPAESLDGMIWLKPAVAEKHGWPTSFLARAIRTNANGTYSFLKAKVQVSLYYPGTDGNEIAIPEDADFASTFDNVKWASLEEGIHSFDAFFMASDKEKDMEAQRRKLNVIASILFSEDPNAVRGTLAIEAIHNALEEKSWKVKSDLEDFTAGAVDAIESMMADPEIKDGLVAKQKAMLLALGFGSEQSAMETYDNLLKRTRSAAIDGYWANAIQAHFVKSGEVWMNTTTFNNLKGFIIGGVIGVARYPLASYQSMMSLRVVVKDRDWMGDGMIVVSTADAPYMGLDADDEVLISIPFSGFNGAISGESRIASRNIEAIDFDKVTGLDVYFGGAIAEGLIGMVFNAMLRAIGAGDSDLAKLLGSYLDVAAQAIKKPFDLEPLWMSINDSRVKWSPVEYGFVSGEYEPDYIESLCLIGLKREYVIGIESAFGVEIMSKGEFVASTYGVKIDWMKPSSTLVEFFLLEAKGAVAAMKRPVAAGTAIANCLVAQARDMMEVDVALALRFYLESAEAMKEAMKVAIKKEQDVLAVAMANLDPFILMMGIKLITRDENIEQ